MGMLPNVSKRDIAPLCFHLARCMGDLLFGTVFPRIDAVVDQSPQAIGLRASLAKLPGSGVADRCADGLPEAVLRRCTPWRPRRSHAAQSRGSSRPQ